MSSVAYMLCTALSHKCPWLDIAICEYQRIWVYALGLLLAEIIEATQRFLKYWCNPTFDVRASLRTFAAETPDAVGRLNIQIEALLFGCVSQLCH